MNKIFEFNECISRDPPIAGKGDFLVSYDQSLVFPSQIADSYLKAAELIIRVLCKNKISASDDFLLMPLLNLYDNALEFSLKLQIETAETHRKKKLCNGINPQPSRFEKTLSSSHDLGKLVGIIEVMQSTPSELHRIDHFKNT